MADNIFKRAVNNIVTRLGMAIASNIDPDVIAALSKNRKYYEGIQTRPLKTKAGQADDNLITNFIGLAVDRSNSLLFGGGVRFSVPSGDSAEEQQWLDNVWKANKKNIFLHRMGLDGETWGTYYVKLIPDAIEYNGEAYPRLVLLDPTLMSIDTEKMDIERVERYTWEMKDSENDRVIREVTRRTNEGEEIKNEDGVIEPAPTDTWVIETFVADGRSTSFRLIKSVLWLYPFPPIIHGQNLPSLHSVYGADGIGGGIQTQDKFNFVRSNALKIMRYHGHPKTWGRGIPSGEKTEKVAWGADEIIKIPGENGMLANLEMNSDLGAHRTLAQDLRQEIFDMARVVDTSTVKDKVGQLTNFGIRMLYSDALSKNATRRALYGDMLTELNRRMLTMYEYPPENSVIWGDDLPADEKENAALILNDLNAGLISKETAASERGYLWNTKDDGNIGEKDKIASEKAADTANSTDALARLLAGTTTP